MQTHLFNIVNPDVTHPDFNICFYAGDILFIKTDILVVSAFQNNFYPLTGTILGDLYEKLEIKINRHDLISISENLSIVHFDDINLPFRKILIVEMNDLTTDNPLNIVRFRFTEIRNYISNIIGELDKAISFPLLGTGSQGLSKETVAIELLSLSRSFAQTSIREINIFAHDFESVALLNLNIDYVLNRQKPTSLHHELMYAVNDEIQTLAKQNESSEYPEINQFAQLINSPGVSVDSIATFGRKVCELYADKILIRFSLNPPQPSNLDAKIKTFSPLLLNSTKSYILSYIRLLQACGNIAAHQINNSLSEYDMAAISIAIIRVHQFLLSPID
jgi:hypothetical protein